MTLKAGSQLGPYEVVGLLGSGGMGEVYRARDPRLDRDVAIKVLIEEITDADHLRRFEQEARAAGALNHPNVLAVYDIGTHEGVPYVVSELLEGRTLRARLAGGALPVRQATEYGLQIAHGLAAAHERGIVHRDLKPENVFLTREGHVKILDFGLAKLERPSEGVTASDQEPTASWKTDPGTLLGTAGYMSPEQIRGQDVDQRSDIFSLGAVLYEMLSGRRAFRRESPIETMHAILADDPPDPSEAGRVISPVLGRIVQRCLEKRPGDRFDSAHDLAFALEAVASGTSGPSWAPIPRLRRRVRAGALVGLVALVTIAGLWIGWPREPPPEPLRIRPITSDPGAEWAPALSPDGNLVAFVATGASGEQGLYVKQVDGGGEPLVISSGDGGTLAPAWSPDGQRIAFARHIDAEGEAAGDGVFVISALGGTTRRLATLRGVRGLSWSPDGKHLAVPHQETVEDPSSLFLLSLEGSERRRLTSPPSGYTGDSRPRFSPDGRMLAFVRTVVAFESDIYVVPVGGGKERRLTEGNCHTAGLEWTADGRGIVFSSWRLGGAGESSLWRVPASGGAPEPLEFGEYGSAPTLSREGGRLAYVRWDRSMHISRVSGPSAPEEERSRTRLVSSTRLDYHPRYSPDGQQIAFVSSRTGAAEIWICGADGSKPRQATFLDDPLTMFPAWSPEGEEIAFSSRKEGSDDVYVVSLSGGLPRRLTMGSSVERGASWSRDGRWIYFFSNRTGRFEVWKAPAQGGDALQVTTRGGTWALESHDSRFLYFGKATGEGGLPGIWRTPIDGGAEVRVLDQGGAGLWALMEQGILYVDFGSGLPTLELFHFATDRTRQVAVLEDVGAPGLSVSPDGRWVLHVGSEGPEADIMLVEGFR